MNLAYLLVKNKFLFNFKILDHTEYFEESRLSVGPMKSLKISLGS